MERLGDTPLRKLALLEEVDPETLGDPAQAIKLLKHWRERCLYVEASHPGNPLTPRGLIDPGGLDAEGLSVFARWTDQQIPRIIERLKNKPT